METISLGRDELKVIMNMEHPLVEKEKISVEDICKYPFLLLEKNNNKVVSEVFQEQKPNVKLTTWDDYSIMSLVESGFGISVLPELILKRIPYNIATKCLENPVYREIGFIIKDYKTASLAVKCFTSYLKFIS